MAFESSRKFKALTPDGSPSESLLKGHGLNYDKTAAKKKVRALIVDDEKLSRLITKALLGSFRIECEEAENGAQAIALLLEKEHFDLVLMDKDMPVMNGVETTKKIRAMGVPVMIVGVTADSSEENKKKFIEAGLDAFFVKPMTSAMVTQLLQELEKKL